MKERNGVKVITENCSKCVCRECHQWDYSIKRNGHIKCPFEYNPCTGCQKKEYAEDCVFKL